MLNIGQSTIKELPLLLPPEDEAENLISELKTKLDVLGSASSKASLQIQLLQERRTALISAAVTGKIDVRDWQPPTSSSSDEAHQ